MAEVELPVLSAQQPVAGDLKPTSAFLLFMEKTRKAVVNAFADLQALVDALAQAVLAIIAAQAAADAAQASADVADAKAVVADDKAEAAQDDATQALLDAASAQTDADAAATLALNASNDAATAQLAVDDIVSGATPLDPEVITTTQLAPDAVTTSDVAYTATNTSIAGAGDTTVQTLNITVASGVRVDLTGSVALDALGKNGSLGQYMGYITVKLKRDGTTIYSAKACPVIHGIRIPLVAIAVWSDVPGAGTFTYTLVTELSNAGDTSSATAESRYIQAEQVKR